jgi:hypothetical protein
MRGGKSNKREEKSNKRGEIKDAVWSFMLSLSKIFEPSFSELLLEIIYNHSDESVI